MRKNRAFTLLELIIVVAIVGILLAISLAFLSDAKTRGNDTGKIQTMAETRKALQIYAADKGGFPDSITELVNSGDIDTIDPSILYVGLNGNNVCNTSPCSTYHLAVVLKDINNGVLKTDSDQTTGSYDGTTNNCLPGGGIPELCYDIVP